ncbi:MAG: cysteine--tRNA ligase [Verrucomicrobiota bacterium]
MPLRLYDTRSRALRELKPIAETFRFYCCGPTVYGPAHIGNFRTFVVQDVLRRVLELSGTPTQHVRNITDVDDKTIRDSQRAGQPLGEFTAHWLERFRADSQALGLLPPHEEPSAVAHLPQQIAMIERLVAKGHAYQGADGSVYFRVGSFPGYGGLSRLDQRELRLGATATDSDEYEKDALADFALWKARKPEDGENFWSSPWGEGRPGWHLECSAMCEEYFGEEFDLHSGGIDLVFPHHENEIAQSCCANGGAFAHHWHHVTHLLVDGGKMSKSLGNLYTVEDLAKEGFPPELVRYVLASGYYRRPLNFTFESLEAARSSLHRLEALERELAERVGPGTPPSLAEGIGLRHGGVFQPAWEGLLDDLNAPLALGKVFGGAKQALAAEDAEVQWRGLWRILRALGLAFPEKAEAEAPAEVRDLAQKRWEAKQAKDWGVADALREQVTAQGWIIKDTRDGFELVAKESQSLNPARSDQG